MKTLKNRLISLLLLAAVGLWVLCPAAGAAGASLPELPSDQCVVDDANVLSDSTVQTLNTLNGKLQTNCSGACIGVLTVEYTGSLSTEDYALEAFNTWGVGSSENNGVLILLVMQSPEYDDGDYYLTYGTGFRNTTLASQASAIAQTMEESFAAQDYDAAVVTCAENTADLIAQIYGVSLNADTSGGTAQPGPAEPSLLDQIGEAILSLIALAILVYALFSMFVVPFGHSLGWYWGPFGWFGGRRNRPRPPHDPAMHQPPPPHHNPRPPRSPRPPRGPGAGGGMGGPRPPRGGMGGGNRGGMSGGSFGGSSRGGGSFGGMGGGRSMGGGGGRGR